jgi:integrative and conjugative element protein (TIGR02256 family)
MYKHVFIVRSILDVIRAEVRRAGRRETGGALVGYLSPESTLFVTHASGPGPRAQLQLTSVLIDGQYAHEFCTRIFTSSGGRLDYVGDWHRHLGWSLAASDQDLEAMLTISDSNCCSLPYPLTAIYRSFPERMVTHALNNRRLRPVAMNWLDKIPE